MSRLRRVLSTCLTVSATLVTLVQATPAAAVAGQSWQLVLNDDFNGSSIDASKWSVYGSAGSTRARVNASVINGMLTLRTTRVNGQWKGAGVSGSRGLVQTYGKYEMRARFSAGYGVRAAGLLWPAGGGWPPEVDFFEVASVDTYRTTNHLTNHYGAANSMQHASETADFTQWHVVGVEWTPDALRYTLDGVVKVTMTNNVPNRSMWLALQSGITGMSAQPGASTPAVVDFDIDWVKIYRRA